MAATLVIATACGWNQGAATEPPPLPISMDSGAAPAAARTGPSLPGVSGGASASRSAKSVLIGVGLIDYLLLSLGQDTSARAAGIDVAAELRAMDGGSAVAAKFDSLSANGVTSLPSSAIVEAIEQVVDWRRFRAAGWAELARLFATDRFELGFRWTQLRGAIEDTWNTRELTAESRSLADNLLTSIATGPRNFAAIEKASLELLAALAR